MSSGFMKTNASLIFLLVSASWQIRVDALTRRRSCPSPDCLRESRTNLRGPECSCAWEEQWSEEYQKYYYINRETGQTSWHGPANRMTGSWDGPANLEVFGGRGNLENKDVAPISPAVVTKACRTPEEAKLLERVEESWFNLQRNLMAQEQISSFIDCMDSPDAGSPNIKSQAEATAAEGIPVMASFLGDMWKEMRMFKNPFLKEQLLERAMQLKGKEPGLRQEYKAALSDMMRQEAAWADKAQSDEDDRMISKTRAAKLEEGLRKEEEEDAYDEEEDAKRDNQEDEDEAQEAAEEAQEEKAMVAELAKAKEKVAKEKSEEDIADEVAATAEEEAAQTETPKQKKRQTKRGPEDRFVKPAWMRYLEGMDEGDAMVSNVDAEESYQLPIKDIPQRTSEKSGQTGDVEYVIPQTTPPATLEKVEYDIPQTSSQPTVEEVKYDIPQTTSQPMMEKAENDIPQTTSQPTVEKAKASWWTWPWMRDKTTEKDEKAEAASQDDMTQTSSEKADGKTDMEYDIPQTTSQPKEETVVAEEASWWSWPWMRGKKSEKNQQAEVPAATTQDIPQTTPRPTENNAVAEYDIPQSTPQPTEEKTVAQES